MTGKEMAAAMLAIRPDLPIILCTGFSEIITEEAAKQAGIQAFIMKPIIMQELAEAIRTVLDEPPPA
jgi:FixJ family two-component response regulator